MIKHAKILLVLGIGLIPFLLGAAPKSSGKMIGVNVVLNAPIQKSHLSELGKVGKVRDILYEIDALTMQIRESDLAAVQALPFVAAANPDAERNGAPVDTVSAEDFLNAFTTWDMDVINVQDTILVPNDEDEDIPVDVRTVEYTGEGVYVAVLDTGLADSWRQYFPQERIATEYARSFGGGGGEVGNVSSQPNKWEHDQSSHGTHVTSTILGYSLRGTPINGVAPLAKVIPVKVLNQNGSGWSSVIARGIMYVAELKEGPLADFPVVINMSLGGSVLDAVEKAALDYAIDAGVIIVASAGNSGMRGMGYPGAYEPVISVAASGWTGEWYPVGNRNWWNNMDDPDPNNSELYYITDFSSRELAGQDLDIAAPGSWIVGPYKINSSTEPTYYFLGGTSMASPHVAGVAALMLQKNPDLTQAEVEGILISTALTLEPGCRDIYGPSGIMEQVCWDADATGAGVVLADAALDATPAP